MQEALWVPEVPPYLRPTMEEIRARIPNGRTAVGSFSGCGGSSLGLKMAGWRVAAAIEFIPEAARTYRANFPDTILFERDIRRVTAEEILDAIGMRRGELDLFEGSPPCASFSSAGMGDAYREHECKACRGKGVLPAALGGEEEPCGACEGRGIIAGTEKKYSDDAQRTDDLFWEWARILDGLHPKAFVAENVPGMLNGNALEEYFHVICRDLSELGYQVEARVLNSANFGVPQERKRLIFVGYRRDLGIRPTFPAPTTPEPHTTLQALESVAPDDPDHAPYLADSSMEGKAVGRTWTWMTALRDARTPEERAAAARMRTHCARCDQPLADHAERTVEVGSVRKAKAADAKRTKVVPFCADGQKAVEVKEYFLMTLPELDRPSPTITATGAQNGAASVVHPTECRKFTPAEAKALCGFPPDFVLTGTREQRYERMGRAVTPPLYEDVGHLIAHSLRSAENWRCSCGREGPRYDNGDACEACIMESFAEAG